MEWYKKVNMDAKAAFLLTLTERVLDPIENYDWYPIVRTSMDACWEWVEEKKNHGDDLYENVENEDEEGLIFIEGVAYESDKVYSPQVKLVWACVLDAVCYTCWQAYQYEKEYLPQSLEGESDRTIDEFMEKIVKTVGYQEEWADRLKEYLLKHYPSGSDKKIKREELLNIIS
jgi:hypothetical protein